MAGAVSTYYATTTTLARAPKQAQRDSAYCYNLRTTTASSKRRDSMRPRSISYCHRPLPPLPDAKIWRRYSTTVVPPSKRHLSHFPTSPPNLYPKEQVNPLSLQDSSFLYILSQVEHYPSEILAKLPLTWRRKLLSAVPPFRLLLLEKTVGKGIDTDKIWEGLSKLKNSVWASYLKDGGNKPLGIQTSSTSLTQIWDKHHSYGPDHPSLSAKFIDYLTYLLFNEMNRDYACKRITELLHATHVDMLDETMANALIYGHINSLFMFIPPYFLVPFRCPNLTERELYWSLHGNRMQPTSLEVYTYNLDSSPLWNQAIISQGMMRRMLSNLQFLRIYNHKSKTMQLEQVANAVTHSSRYKEPPSSMGSLKHLEILRAEDQHLAVIVPYFSGPNGYSNLTSLTISMKPVGYVQATSANHLGPIIKNQLSSLQHLHLQGLSCYTTKNAIHMRDYMFFDILASLILKQRFCNLVISQFKELPWQLLRMLLEANLRTVPSHKQTLIFRDGTVTTNGEILPLDKKNAKEDEDEGENQFYPAAESKCLERKCIHFDNMSLPINVLEWFERTERLCINTLEFNKVKINPISQVFSGLIKFTIGMGGVEYGQHINMSNDNLKNIFIHHKSFECRVFKWTDVQLKQSALTV